MVVVTGMMIVVSEATSVAGSEGRTVENHGLVGPTAPSGCKVRGLVSRTGRVVGETFGGYVAPKKGE